MNEQQAPKPLAQGPMLVPARRLHSASAKQVPLSPLSPLQAVFWNRTMDKIPGKDGLNCAWVDDTNSIVDKIKKRILEIKEHLDQITGEANTDSWANGYLSYRSSGDYLTVSGSQQI